MLTPEREASGGAAALAREKLIRKQTEN